MSADGTTAVGEGSAVLTHPEPIPDRVARAALDYYPTPAWCAEAIRPHLPHARTVLDPACGVGELLTHFTGEARTFGIEIDWDRSAASSRSIDDAFFGDALAVKWPDADLLICNPPFSHGLEFVEKALGWRHERASVAFLLRLTFLESRERRALHQAHPADVFVLSERPKFRPGRDGKMSTDSVTCAWFVWGPGRGGRWAVL